MDDERDSDLDLLEKLLALTEPYKFTFGTPTRRQWDEISAETADRRELAEGREPPLLADGDPKHEEFERIQRGLLKDFGE